METRLIIAYSLILAFFLGLAVLLFRALRRRRSSWGRQTGRRR